jgi:hypothetical protein
MTAPRSEGSSRGWDVERAARLAGVDEIDLVLYLASSPGTRTRRELVDFIGDLTADHVRVVHEAHDIVRWLLATDVRPAAGLSLEQALVVLSAVRRDEQHRGVGRLTRRADQPRRA